MDERVDVGDVAQVKKRKTKRQVKRDIELEELRQLMSHKAMRKFMWRVLSQCGLYDTLSNGDPQYMAIRSGMRDIGLWLNVELLEADLKLYDRMALEAREEEKNG